MTKRCANTSYLGSRKLLIYLIYDILYMFPSIVFEGFLIEIASISNLQKYLSVDKFKPNIYYILPINLNLLTYLKFSQVCLNQLR